MRLTKLIGLLTVALGALLIVLPAALPATIIRDRSAVFEFQAYEDGCGAAVYAALEHSDRDCGRHARRRLLLTTAGGLVLTVCGVVLFTGPDERQRSRVSLRD